MLKIDNSLLQEVGLGMLPDAEKNAMLKHIYETLEMRVGIRLADQMTNEQLDEFERYFEAKDDAGAFKWLETNFPNYKEIVQQEFDKLKAEVAQSAPQILTATPVAGAQPAPAAPQPPAPAAVPEPYPAPPVPPSPSPGGSPESVPSFAPSAPAVATPQPPVFDPSQASAPPQQPPAPPPPPPVQPMGPPPPLPTQPLYPPQQPPPGPGPV
jgi:Protein of unknown function (DUF5663)